MLIQSTGGGEGYDYYLRQTGGQGGSIYIPQSGMLFSGGGGGGSALQQTNSIMDH